ncbi:AraC family transcriptional regulator [Phenylobacterium sp.]|uniref:AraC family transcriptional regulator n=1 Tax=Phenylobacterium sp. TaxID=1871053 RepID=UPI0025F5392A|nr:AraC family transcriptional regulator [Phenylobacterium sp.]
MTPGRDPAPPGSVTGHAPTVGPLLPRPLPNQKTFAPYKIATLIDTLASHGLSATAVLEGTGLSDADVRDPHTLTSIRQYLAACENAVRSGIDLDVAYEIGARLHLSAYGMYGYALMCSPTMRDFFDFAVRYQPLATPIQQLGWRQDGDRAIWTFTEIYSDLMSEDLRNFLLRQQMMMTSTHMRDVVGPETRPLQACFGLADNGRTAADEAALGCPCRFGEAGHELHYPASILEQAPELANRLTRAMLEDTCDRLAGEANMTTGVAGDVYQLLMLAPNRSPSMPSVAQRLGMTERTLRRRLDDAGHSFASIADEVRKRLTLEYLQTTRISADDIAWKVGFSDSSNLRRAVKRWTGRTFAEVRRG